MGFGAGMILGGLLQGVGKGAQEDILAQRQTALENLRATREAANISLKAGYDDDRADRATKAAYDQATDVAKINQKGGLMREELQGNNRITEVKTKGEIDAAAQARHDAAETSKALAVENLRNSGRQSDIVLADKIARTTVDTTYTNDKGNLVIVAKGGRVITTNIRGERPKPAADGFGLPTPTPIKMPDATTETNAPAPSAPAIQPGTGAPNRFTSAMNNEAPKQSLPKNVLDQRVTEAVNKAAGGDPRYKGLSASQIRAKVADAYRNAGYTVP